MEASESIWWTLTPSDWLEAFSAHPRIGERSLSKWSSDEQSGVDGAQAEVLARLARGNQEYERRFGWIFLVNATGKTAPEMLQVLQSRLSNEEGAELRIAAGEQAKITKLRLEKLLSG